MKKNKILLIIISLFFSCKMYKKEMKINGDKNTAVGNAIIDYYHTHKKYLKENDVFEIVTKESDNSDLYIFNISPRYNFFYLGLKDTIGSVSNHFPTDYKYYRGKLFVWNDEKHFLNEDILKKIYSFNKLDSIRLKYQLGIYPQNDTLGLYPEVPLFRINEKLKGTYYYICKKQLNKFHKSNLK